MVGQGNPDSGHQIVQPLIYEGMQFLHGSGRITKFFHFILHFPEYSFLLVVHQIGIIGGTERIYHLKLLPEQLEILLLEIIS